MTSAAKTQEALPRTLSLPRIAFSSLAVHTTGPSAAFYVRVTLTHSLGHLTPGSYLALLRLSRGPALLGYSVYHMDLRFPSCLWKPQDITLHSVTPHAVPLPAPARSPLQAHYASPPLSLLESRRLTVLPLHSDLTPLESLPPQAVAFRLMDGSLSLGEIHGEALLGTGSDISFTTENTGAGLKRTHLLHSPAPASLLSLAQLQQRRPAPLVRS